MIERTRRRFNPKPQRLAADTAYGTGKFLAFVIDAGIMPHIPVWDKSTRQDNTFSRSDFVFKKKRMSTSAPQVRRWAPLGMPAAIT